MPQLLARRHAFAGLRQLRGSPVLAAALTSRSDGSAIGLAAVVPRPRVALAGTSSTLSLTLPMILHLRRHTALPELRNCFKSSHQ